MAFTTVFVVSGIAQTPPTDADPVLQGTTTYKIPQSAIDVGIDGKVVISVHVDETGKPSSSSIIGGPMWPCNVKSPEALRDFNSTLSDFVMKLHFAPAIKSGKPIAKEMRLVLSLVNPKIGSKPLDVDISKVTLKGKHFPRPPYFSDVAKYSDEGGVVSVQVLIDKGGKVVSAGILKGPPTFQAVSREAACKSEFTPVKIRSDPVMVIGIISYEFIYKSEIWATA